jgi:predicted O-methyltransferase YrrM
MNTLVRDVLSRLERFGREHDAVEAAHDRKMLNLEPDTAKLLSIFLQSSGLQSVLEIGTSNGYSTIWIAWAIQAAKGRVISVDRNPQKLAMARENLARAGLLDTVELKLGEATELIRQLGGAFDAVFFDADRVSAPEQLRILLPKLASHAFLFADNALSHPAEVAGYLHAIDQLQDFMHIVVPVGKGLSVAYRSN